MNCGPLTRVVGILCREKMDFSTVIMVVEVVEVSFCTPHLWMFSFLHFGVKRALSYIILQYETFI